MKSTNAKPDLAEAALQGAQSIGCPKRGRPVGICSAKDALKEATLQKDGHDAEIFCCQEALREDGYTRSHPTVGWAVRWADLPVACLS